MKLKTVVTAAMDFMPKRHFAPKLPLMIAAGAAASGAMLVASGLPATAATAANTTRHGCGINAANLVDQCTSVTFSGKHIVSLSGWSTHLPEDLLSYPSVHIELYGPRGLLKNCGTISSWSSGDTTPTCTWKGPKGSAWKGNYCSRTWTHTGTTFKDLANKCEAVP
jgi:hypothetical protein